MTFSGRLSVQGLAELPEACVRVWGDCTVASRAELRVENCSNTNYMGVGGGVYVLDVSVWRLSARLSEAAAPEVTLSSGGR